MDIAPLATRAAIGDLRRAGYTITRGSDGRYHLDHPPGSPEVEAA